MTSIFDRYNLRPQERRFIVIVALILFVALNVWKVIPYFSEWGRVSAAMAKSRGNLKKYQEEIARKPEYEAKLKELQGEGGNMLTNDLQFQRIVQSQVAAAGLRMGDLHATPVLGGRTNQFFQEQALSLGFDSGGKELVDFLVNIASTNVMIRVRELNVKPDPSQSRLLGNIVLVGNYGQGKGPALPKAAATPVKPTGAKTTPPTKTNATQKVSPPHTNAPAHKASPATANPTPPKNLPTEKDRRKAPAPQPPKKT